MASDFEHLQHALPERYTLLRELDRGGMSHVYLAHEEMPDRDVAIKVFDKTISAQLGRERFVREVEVTSRLGHPHIVPIYAAGVADGELYYVMPFIGGESLRDRLGREKQLPIDEALRITEQVAGALAHAHSQGVVHRDIKPANILFQSGQAVVADFGIARALGVADGGTTLTGAGNVLGTPDYMSPEQIAGGEEIDERTDIYSLACVLFEMLGGQPPFHSRTSQATMARHLTDGVPSLRALRDGVTPAVEHAVQRALAKVPADRFATVSEFSGALRAQSPRPVPGAEDPSRERTLLSSAGLSLRLAGVLLAAGAVGFAYNAWFGRETVTAMAGVPPSDSVAMMPLDNFTGDPSLDYVGRSIASQVADHFQQIPSIRVAGTYSVTSLYDKNLGYAALLDSLNVGHLLEGQIEQRDGQITIRVTDTDTRGVIDETRTFPSFRIEDLDSAIVAIAHSIAVDFLARNGISALEGDLDVEHGAGREAYLLGMEALGRRTRDGMLRAEEFFLESIALDSTYALPYAALSSVYALSLSYRYDLGRDAFDVAGLALAYADHAIALDPGLSAGYASRGYALVLEGLDIDEAEADFRRAQLLSPNEPSGASWSARVFAERGQIPEALAAATRARDADRLQAGRHIGLAALQLQAGMYAEAIRSAQMAYGLEPRLARARAHEAFGLALLGRSAECLGLELGAYALVRAICLTQAGDTEGARALVVSHEAAYAAGTAGDPDYLEDLVAAELATYYAFVNDAVASARWVAVSFGKSPVGVDSRILESEIFQRVRSDPLFSTTLAEARRDSRTRVEEAWQRFGGGGLPRE